MAGANVFHVAFGFNATELTTCLEEENYNLAEQMIYEHAHTPYLDEGMKYNSVLVNDICLFLKDTIEQNKKIFHNICFVPGLWLFSAQNYVVYRLCIYAEK